MSYVRDEDPYLVQIQETERMSMCYSARTEEEAFCLALAAHGGGDPDAVEVIERATGRAVYDTDTIDMAYMIHCEHWGIKVWRYNVSDEFKDGRFQFHATPVDR